MRSLVLLSLIALLSVPSLSKDKQKQKLPNIVLNARTVAVIVDPDAGAPISNPGEHNEARLAVEHALQQWGRFRVQPYTFQVDAPDLLIEVRKGGGVRSTIHGGPVNGRPPIDTTGLGTVISSGSPSYGKPTLRAEYSPAEDIFAVYAPTETSKVLLWRFSAKHCLDAPVVRAVAEFRKAITESEEAKKQSKP